MKIQLHRIESSSEWEQTKSEDRNVWQRMAARTRGLITPGNIVTIIGFILVIIGLIGIIKHQYWLGFAGILVGRLLDIVDGWVADKTGTKSPLGEALDATVDKLSTALALGALLVANVILWWLLLAIFLPHALIALASMISMLRGKRLHPSKFGKLSMALAWVGLCGFILTAALQLHDMHFLHYISYGFVAVSVWLAFYAAIQYTAGEH